MLGQRKEKMKKIFYTQRVEVIESYGERRDCADQNIPRFLQASGYLPFPVPNVIEDLDSYLKEANPDGILLTGGNSLVCYGGSAEERDRTDEQIICWAVKNRIPMYGFCRGMQSILVYFGVKLEQVKNHAGVRHIVKGDWGKRIVNSYHNQAATQVNDQFIVTASGEDGVIEAIEHKEYPIAASMWHPEREVPFAAEDMQRVQELYQ